MDQTDTLPFFGSQSSLKFANGQDELDKKNLNNGTEESTVDVNRKGEIDSDDHEPDWVDKDLSEFENDQDLSEVMNVSEIPKQNFDENGKSLIDRVSSNPGGKSLQETSVDKEDKPSDNYEDYYSDEFHSDQDEANFVQKPDDDTKKDIYFDRKSAENGSLGYNFESESKPVNGLELDSEPLNGIKSEYKCDDESDTEFKSNNGPIDARMPHDSDVDNTEKLFQKENHADLSENHEEFPSKLTSPKNTEKPNSYLDSSSIHDNPSSDERDDLVPSLSNHSNLSAGHVSRKSDFTGLENKEHENQNDHEESHSPRRNVSSSYSNNHMPSLGSRKLSNLSKGTKKGRQSRVKSTLSLGLSPRRELSAKRITIEDLKKEIEAINEEIDNLRLENKVLKRNNALQSKQIDRCEKDEESLPTMLDRQTREVKALKEQLRRHKDRYDKTRRVMRHLEGKVRRTNREARQIEEEANEKELEARCKMKRQVEKIEEDAAACDERIQQLTRYAGNLEKNHKAEMNLEMERHSQTRDELDSCLSKLNTVKEKVQAKEAELENVRVHHSRLSVLKSTTHQNFFSRESTNIISSKDDDIDGKRRLKSKGSRELMALPAPADDANKHKETNGDFKLTPSPPDRNTKPQSHTPRPNRTVSRIPSLEENFNRDIKLGDNVSHQTSSADEIPASRPAEKNGRKIDGQPTSNKPRNDIYFDSKPPSRSFLQDERRKAELIRTNMVLSQTMLNRIDSATSVLSQEARKSNNKFDKEDSWEAIRLTQEKINLSLKPSDSTESPRQHHMSTSQTRMDSSMGSMASLRRMQASTIKEDDGNIEDDTDEITIKKKNASDVDNRFSQDFEMASQKSLLDLSQRKGTADKQHEVNGSRSDVNTEANNFNDDIFDFGGYQPSSSAAKSNRVSLSRPLFLLDD